MYNFRGIAVAISNISNELIWSRVSNAQQMLPTGWRHFRHKVSRSALMVDIIRVSVHSCLRLLSCLHPLHLISLQQRIVESFRLIPQILANLTKKYNGGINHNKRNKVNKVCCKIVVKHLMTIFTSQTGENIYTQSYVDMFLNM